MKLETYLRVFVVSVVCAVTDFSSNPSPRVKLNAVVNDSAALENYIRAEAENGWSESVPFEDLSSNLGKFRSDEEHILKTCLSVMSNLMNEDRSEVGSIMRDSALCKTVEFSLALASREDLTVRHDTSTADFYIRVYGFLTKVSEQDNLEVSAALIRIWSYLKEDTMLSSSQITAAIDTLSLNFAVDNFLEKHFKRLNDADVSIMESETLDLFYMAFDAIRTYKFSGSISKLASCCQSCLLELQTLQDFDSQGLENAEDTIERLQGLVESTLYTLATLPPTKLLQVSAVRTLYIEILNTQEQYFCTEGYDGSDDESERSGFGKLVDSHKFALIGLARTNFHDAKVYLEEVLESLLDCEMTPIDVEDAKTFIEDIFIFEELPRYFEKFIDGLKSRFGPRFFSNLAKVVGLSLNQAEELSEYLSPQTCESLRNLFRKLTHE